MNEETDTEETELDTDTDTETDENVDRWLFAINELSLLPRNEYFYRYLLYIINDINFHIDLYIDNFIIYMSLRLLLNSNINIIANNLDSLRNLLEQL